MKATVNLVPVGKEVDIEDAKVNCPTAAIEVK
jgi:ferredoxin